MHSCIPIHALINTLEDKIPPTADNTDTDHHASIQKPRVIPLLKSGVSALQAESDRLGLGFDDWQIEWCRHLFQDELRRDPTEVELFDIAGGAAGAAEPMALESCEEPRSSVEDAEQFPSNS